MPGNKNKSIKSVIDADIEDKLFVELVPVPLKSATRAAILCRTLGKIKGLEKPSFVTVRDNDGHWNEVAAGVFQKRLVGNAKMNVSLYRMLPGSSFPAHDHPSDEECICLEGEVDLGGIYIRAGDFHLAPKGLRHNEIRTTKGCLLYIRCGA